jgi:hypothetical protein
METKKFVNLSNDYKHFLNICNNKINHLEIDQNTSLDLLNKYHNEIQCEILGTNNSNNSNSTNNSNNSNSFDNNFEISDINHILANYEKENSIVTQLRKLVHYRNYLILKAVLRSNIWKEFILSLREKCKESGCKKLSIKIIEETFLKLLEIYIEYWNGFWKFFTFNKKNQIKDIVIIDPEDYKIIFQALQ